MSQSKTINTISGKLTLEKGDWSYITSARFYTLEATINLTWKCLDPDIAQINPNSGLIYAKNEGETSVIGISNDEAIRVLCTVNVQPKTAKVVKTANVASTATITPRCGGNCSGDITALGYSGTVFSYTEVGSRVTLEKGFGAKNGTRNFYSDLFRSALVEMDNIYASMSPDQRAAWIELRLKGFLSNIVDMLTNSPSDYLIGLVKDALINSILPLDEIEALVRGFYSWHVAEENAISCYQAF